MARNPPSDHKARSPAEILTDPATSFGGLLERASLLLRLEKRLGALLEPTLAAQCRVANLRQNRLILVVPGAAWATRLRMESPGLLETLRRSGLPDLAAIDVRVAPPREETPPVETTRALSPAARRALDLMSRLGTESED